MPSCNKGVEGQEGLPVTSNVLNSASDCVGELITHFPPRSEKLNDNIYDKDETIIEVRHGFGSAVSRNSHLEGLSTYQAEEPSAYKGYSDTQRVHPSGCKKKFQNCDRVSKDEVDDETSDDCYWILEEQDDDRVESHNEDTPSSNAADHLEWFQNDRYSFDSKEAPNLNPSIDDHSSIDEYFICSQAKCFPPPISILVNETHHGLPTHIPKTLWRSVKRDGRFVLQEVQVLPYEFFQATRECGRLRLQLVCPGSDYSGGYSGTASLEADQVSLLSSDNAHGFDAITEVCQHEEHGTLTSMGVHSYTNMEEKIVDCICEENEIPFKDLLPSTCSHGEHDKLHQEQCSDAQLRFGINTTVSQMTFIAS
ncbi:hypothetical protein KP509_01G046100 [Ceratopteris richardii]|nr:hypothetical protein KP509_01G046100 [Ceratopteris richardii]